jgi:histidinol-phosphatase
VSEVLEFALQLADEADQITMARFLAHDLVVNSKPDLTPVTEADRAAEQAIRTAIGTRFPNDAILGEEFGSDGISATGRTWIIDPIDGTKNYVRGVPIWATLIGVAEGDQILAGVVSAPALGRRWWAEKGGGAWMLTTLKNGTNLRKLQVSDVGQISDASISYASLDAWIPFGREPNFRNLMRNAWRTRAYGDFYSYMLVAEGAADVAAEPELELYDMAALVPIVLEAGGEFTSLDGEPGPWGGNAVATNGQLHKAVIAALA